MNVSEAVEQALRLSEEARNTDKILILQVWESLGLHLTSQQRQKFIDLPSSESITRIRRKIQEQERYPAVHKIKKARELKNAIIQQNMPAASIKTTERVLEQSIDIKQLSLI